MVAQVWANMVTAFEYVEDCNRKVLNYGWIEFPLAYTQVRQHVKVDVKEERDGLMQVATFSVYAYFTAALFGRQFLEPRGEHKSVCNSDQIQPAGQDFIGKAQNKKLRKHVYLLIKLPPSDNTTFPAVPNMNFAAAGPFANHTPGLLFVLIFN